MNSHPFLTPTVPSDASWETLSYEEKNKLLYERQRTMLAEFLERGAISKVQYDKSLHDLTEKFHLF